MVFQRSKEENLKPDFTEQKANGKVENLSFSNEQFKFSLNFVSLLYPTKD